MEDNAFPIDQFWRFLQSPALIARVVDSRESNKWFGQIRTAHDEQFLSNPTKHSASPSLASIRALQTFVKLLRASSTIFFAHYCRTWSTFYRPQSFFSKMARFRFVSAAIHKWKLAPFNFSLLIHVEPKYRASFGIQSYVNGSELFYGRCFDVLWSVFRSDVARRNMSVYLDFLKNFFNFFNDWPARARFIFNIEISGTKASKLILKLAFT